MKQYVLMCASVVSLSMSSMSAVQHAGDVASNSDKYQQQCEQINVEQTFDGFDEFDCMVEQAIDKGILKDKPEMRQPMYPEVVLRRVVGYLFMKYLRMKELIGYSYDVTKKYIYSLASLCFGSQEAL